MIINTNSSDIVHSGNPPIEDRRIIRRIGLVCVILAIGSGFTTFGILLGLIPVLQTETGIQTALLINAALVFVLFCVVLWELIIIWRTLRSGRAAAQLHGRIVVLFGLVAATPAILVAIFASVTLERGLDRWFGSQMQAMITNSTTVASAYIREHQNSLRRDLAAFAADINNAEPAFAINPIEFNKFMNAKSREKGIPLVYLLASNGAVLLQTENEIIKNPPDIPDPRRYARADDVPMLISLGNTNLVGGIVRLTAFADAYLYAVQVIDPVVLEYLHRTNANVAAFRQMERSSENLKLAFLGLYTGVAITVLLAAVWLGIGFADRLVDPIRRLIYAADEVSKGNLVVQVPVEKTTADLGKLSATFNNMTSQLRSQRDEILLVKDQADARRRFTEAVLSGVTSGVIGVNEDELVTLVNKAAVDLLNVEAKKVVHKPIGKLIPEMSELLSEARRKHGSSYNGQIKLTRKGRERTLTVRITSETRTDLNHNYVVTLDDITDLVTAQRTSAWADVARRIAHEIKNPLTPIQLSAERLKRRFGKQIAEEDRKVFDQCTDTIVRQVGDIGRMVNEFSSFARMPKPTFEHHNLTDVLNEAVFLQKVGTEDITFEINIPKEMPGMFDHRLISQAFTNLVKNAKEAIEAVSPEDREIRGPGAISVFAGKTDENYTINIIDNGIGFPGKNRHQLLEPYVTNRDKGTGLGLAIVKKILEEHNGTLALLDADPDITGHCGACMQIVIPVGVTSNSKSNPIHKNNNTSGSG